MRNTIVLLLSILLSINVSIAQNVDSFTVSKSKPFVCDTVELINLSTNYTSLKWEITSGGYVPVKDFPFGSNPQIRMGGRTGCRDIRLIIVRGSIKDTFEQKCVIDPYDYIDFTLRGKAIDTVDVYNTYIDSGCYATNWCSGIQNYTKKGKLNTSVVGKYSLVYYAETFTHFKDSTERIVYVVDRQNPIVSLLGYGIIEIDLFCNFIDPGITATDNYCKNLIIRKIGFVDSSKVGEYKIIYEVEDSSGNKSSVVRTVQVINSRPPYFENNSIEIPVFSKYTPEYKINHYCCELKDIEVFTIGKVDTAKIGTYTLKAWLKDCNGFVSDTSIQVVKVVDKTPPVIKLNGPSLHVFEQPGDRLNFNPLDFIIVNDNYDKNVKIDMTGSYFDNYLQSFKMGYYTIIINAKDSSGNFAKSLVIYVKVTVSIPETQIPIANIFPNPSNGIFKLEITNPELAGFARVVDMTGKQILTITSLQQSNEITLPESCQGMYILQVVTQKGVFSEKIFIREYLR